MDNWNCNCTGPIGNTGLCECQTRAQAARDARLAVRGTEPPRNPTTGHTAPLMTFGAELNGALGRLKRSAELEDTQ